MSTSDGNASPTAAQDRPAAAEPDYKPRFGVVTQEVALVHPDVKLIPVGHGVEYEQGELVQNLRTGELVRVVRFFAEGEHDEAPAIETQRGVGSVAAEMRGGDELLTLGQVEIRPARTRDEELDAASIDLARATERFKRAQAEAIRVNPPVGTPGSQKEWSAWLSLIFREGPRERVVSLSDEQLASISRYAKTIKLVTPFGHLVVVAADELPIERPAQPPAPCVDESNADDDCGAGGR